MMYIILKPVKRDLKCDIKKRFSIIDHRNIYKHDGMRNLADFAIF